MEAKEDNKHMSRTEEDNKHMKRIFWMLLGIFFLAGTVIGIGIGGSYVHTAWLEYNTFREEEIHNDCVCINKPGNSYRDYPLASDMVSFNTS